MRTRIPHGAALAAAAAALALLSVAGCRKEGGGSPAPSTSEQRYTFRAEVVKLPDPGHARPQVTLRHEAIPDFRDQSGSIVGMASMVMPFDVAPSAAFTGIGVGDKVQVELVADWTKPSFRIVTAAKLPSDTALDFTSSAKRP